MNTGLSILDYAVIAVFFAVMLGVGVWYTRRSTSSDQFFGNDKTVPWWLAGVSFYMNSFSALAKTTRASPFAAIAAQIRAAASSAASRPMSFLSFPMMVFMAGCPFCRLMAMRPAMGFRR